MKILGDGLYDAPGKKVKFLSEIGEIQVLANWDRKEKMITCNVPPLSWMFNGQEPSSDMLESAKGTPVGVYLTLNGQEWIYTADFKYHDVTLERVSYEHDFKGVLDEEVSLSYLSSRKRKCG